MYRKFLKNKIGKYFFKFVSFILFTGWAIELAYSFFCLLKFNIINLSIKRLILIKLCHCYYIFKL